MSRARAGRSRRERGAAAVEMAIILPLLLLIVGGIIDFGRLFYTQNIVVNAAREGARSRALLYTIPTATTRVKQSLTGMQAPPNSEAISFQLVQGTGNTLTNNADCPSPATPLDRQRVTVTVPQFKYLVLGPASRLFGGALNPPTPRGVAEMRCGG